MAGTIGRRDLAEITAALGGAALLTASWVVVVTRDDVPALEVRAFVAANGLPNTLWPLVWAPVQAGSLVGSLVIVAASAAVTRRKRLTAATLLAAQGGVLGGEGREAPRRPGAPATVAPGRRGARAGDRPRVRVRALGRRVRARHRARVGPPGAWRIVPFAIATGVGFGRVYAGVHLPLDVVGGIGLGLLAGTAARWGLGLDGAARAHH